MRTVLLVSSLLAAILVATALPGPVAADAETAAAARRALAAELGRAVGAAQRALASSPDARIGVHVVDLATGAEVYAHHEGTAINPASNAKLLVAAAALWALGPAFTAQTRFWGTVEGDTVRGDLVFEGRGDPTLEPADLWWMAVRLRARGVTRIEGGVTIDDDYFGDGPLPYAFDEQPNEDASFRAPVGAAAFDAGTFTITLGPGTAAGESAWAWSWPEGFLEIRNEARTTAGAGNQLRLFASAAADGRTRARVWGTVGAGAGFGEYDRRIDDPRAHLAAGLFAALEAAGIAVGSREVRHDDVPEGLSVLVRHESEPLVAWLWQLGKSSSNFHAEQLLRIVGAERAGEPGTAERGAAAVRAILEERGVPVEGLVLRNGSGLFDADRVPARTFTGLLAAVFADATAAPEFLSQLSIAGTDGTLRNRLCGREKGRVRAKTGTLAAVSALSGYVLSPDGRSGYAFSVLVDGARGRTGDARTLQDAVASALVRAAP
jgi:D-alanyl-D-alanine carboxypeptidase/D-alanyl-D-alanine-endopeptidase (penicillin-binding protein 4)